MLDIIRLNEDKRDKISLLDFGCGAAHLWEYMQKSERKSISYAGLDISDKFVELVRKKHPAIEFYCGDILDSSFTLPMFDYIVMNGVFTEKKSLSFEEMWSYFTQTIEIVYKKCNCGIAFNVMSKNVDWEREDLFHVPTDQLTDFLCKNLSRDFVIRNDYGLYEYSVYIYKR